ncbi:hypothetical protein E7811_12270 [Aliigemmobacter aestuarii]|uniref:Antibiotic biosynthesis monooxygenase n=1 Tax=Aliigemmobacter aestuarii TaxID=1445661 RepID=A0A4S3MP49_9RHOB|nr:hypothetical protein [Gemmobacter aestuarii]THD82919.1 hypothetical protein E7811_12270 [Gemmobacter aestuarii]
MPATVLELVTFRLIHSTDPEDFLAVAEATRPLVAAQPGFRNRSLGRDETGVWVDLVEWDSLTAARSAAQAMREAPAFAPFMAMIAPASLAMRHLPVALAMSGQPIGN